MFSNNELTPLMAVLITALDTQIPATHSTSSDSHTASLAIISEKALLMAYA
jgi:hypothetical protein